MKILYIQPAEGFGGAERQGTLHIRGLRARGFEVVPVVGPSPALARELTRVGVADFTVGEHFPAETHSKLSVLGDARFAHDYVQAFRLAPSALIELARARDIDLIISNRSFGWAIAAPVAHALGLPYLVRIGSRPSSWWQTVLLRMLLHQYGQPTALICNCDAVVRSLATYTHAPVELVPNGVDTTRFDPARGSRGLRDRIGAAANTLLVGLPARPAPGKGLELLAEVASRCRLAEPQVDFVVAGEFGWRGYYEDLFRRRGLADRVTFVGHVADMERFYATCDMVIHTSCANSIEGAPNAILEAMAMERPVVATRVGGVSEIIRDGTDGFLVDDRDAGALAGSLMALARDAALRHRIGHAARQRILDVFSEERAVDRLVEVIHDYGEPRRTDRRAAPRGPAAHAPRPASSALHHHT